MPMAAKRSTKGRKPAKTAPRRAAARAPTRAKAARAKPARMTATRAAKPAMNAVGHIELYSYEPPATRRFYNAVFGWTFEETSYGPGMTYTMFRAPGAPHGGLMGRNGVPAETPATLVYINVADLDKTVRDIEGAGGKVHMRMEVPHVGWFAVFEAPGGIVQAVWQAHPDFQPKA
jgi:uncharacterized protein